MICLHFAVPLPFKLAILPAVINPENKVGSKHLFAWQEFAADLEELLEKQINQVADQPRVFEAPDQSLTSLSPTVSNHGVQAPSGGRHGRHSPPPLCGVPGGVHPRLRGRL